MSTFPLSVERTLIYDTVIVGGGFAGVGAAVSSAKNGARTLLIECSGELGGDITKAIVPQILDPAGKGGLVRDLYAYLNEGGHTSARRGPRYTEDGQKIPGTVIDLEYTKYYLEKACREAGADLLLYTMLAGCECREGRIVSVAAATECGAVRIEAPVFIDATGNGLLAYMAGCEYEIGHPETGQPQPAGSALLVTGFTNPPRCETNEDKELLKAELKEAGIEVSSEGIAVIPCAQDGVWLLTFNSQFDVKTDDPAAFSRASCEARAECVEVFEKLKRLDRYAGMTMLASSSHIGVREGRRIRGAYRLTFEDITEGRRFEDGICLVRFAIDVHRISPDDHFVHNKGKRVIPYHIPYRALLPLGCENLLLAGRCISGDFWAHSSYRVAGCVTPMGEAAGYAASLCASGGGRPGDVDGRRVSTYMASLGYEL